MLKRSYILLSVLVLASMVLAACGGAGGGGNTLKIVSSLPMTGSSLTQTQTIVNAMQLRLEQAGGKACGGKYTVTYEAWDDASAALGQWDPAVETENANKAAADASRTRPWRRAPAKVGASRACAASHRRPDACCRSTGTA